MMIAKTQVILEEECARSGEFDVLLDKFIS